MLKIINSLALAGVITIATSVTFADDSQDSEGKSVCKKVMPLIDGHEGLKMALKGAVKPSGGPSNGGLDFHMWATVVADDGTVCAIAKTGDDINDQWLGSRVISAQKANTAVDFSLQYGNNPTSPLDGLALSTANLWAPTQPGGSLFGLQFSNPVNPDAAYRGNSKNYGQHNDPLVGKKVGGVNVFGGGLALYDEEHNLVGAIGVSGDTSCADHNIAWRTRDALGLDNVPAGLSGAAGDNIIFDLDVVDDPATPKIEEPSGFGHPKCGPNVDTVNAGVVADHPIGPNP